MRHRATSWLVKVQLGPLPGVELRLSNAAARDCALSKHRLQNDLT